MDFWTGVFGNEYTKRNNTSAQIISNREMFRKILPPIKSMIEFGAGTGMNIRAIKHLYPEAITIAVEVNESACDILKKYATTVIRKSVSAGIFYEADLVLCKGILIHIPPDELPEVYDNIYKCSSEYILIAEYYNPKPMEVPYRGNDGVMWKRDFAGELMDRYPLELVDYGFKYHRDKNPQDDITWFLLRKV